MKIAIKNVPNEKAVEYANEFNNYKRSIGDKYNALLAELQNRDLQITDIEHCIELLNLPAPTISKLSKKLKELLQERRDIKNELAIVQTIHDKINKKGDVQVNANKIYKFRTDVIAEYVKDEDRGKTLSLEKQMILVSQNLQLGYVINPKK